MVENKIRAICYLDADIEYLEEIIKNAKNENEKLKLQIQKKELMLQKMDLEQA